jgi:tetratricopeptide (TPR) repeat protein
MKSAAKKVILLVLFTALARVCAIGQTLDDVPSSPARASAIQDLPLDSEVRVVLAKAIENGDYDRAEKLLVAEIERNPKSQELLEFLAGIFFLDGKHLNSAVALKKAEDLGPLDDRSRFTLALSYIIMDHRDWARPELEKLRDSDSKNALYPYWLGRLDYDGMQFTSAVANFKKAKELDPFFMKVYDNLALCYEALGKFDQAIRTYEEAVRLNREKKPSSPWPPLNLGALLVRLRRLQDAEASLKESLSYDPKFPQALYQMGLLLEKQKNDDEAIEALRQAADLDPTYAEPHYVLGRIYKRKGESENAETAWSTFQRLKKEHPGQRPH